MTCFKPQRVRAYLPLLAAIFGLFIGSFLNVCIHRIPRGESIVFPPSKCPGCGTKIKPWDNIPVLSYLLLLGRCRGCGQWISLRYPVVELLSGLLALTMFSAFGLTPAA
ncbi:MAG TPA: prepilin peptidase, partial [Deltaproteobacteria bacterium]|nr:prepilin peptidase [Deltaproteobacteria bacterium]